MYKIVKKVLLSTLLSTMCFPAYALTTASLSGPTYLDPVSGPSLRTRIYNAFDLAYVTANPSGVTVGSTFLDRDPAYPDRPLTSLIKDSTPLNAPGQSAGYTVKAKTSDSKSVKERLQEIANKGYTHIQISSPCQAVPTVRPKDSELTNVPYPNGINDTWPLAYAPYICNLSYAPTADTTAKANSEGSYAKNKPYYQTELEDAQKIASAVQPNDLSRYGVSVGDIIVGFRLGSDRFGSAKDLATLVKEAHKLGLKVIADVVLHQIGVQSNNFSPLTHLENGTNNQCPFYAINCYLGQGVVNGAATGQPVTSQYNPNHNSGPIDYYNVYPNAYWALTLGDANPSITSPKVCINSKTTNGAQPSGGATNFTIPFDSKRPELWTFGPLLNLVDTTVQTMVKRYLQLLADIGIDGIRLDAIKDIVVPSLDNEGIGVIDAILNPFQKTFSFGYGEAFDGNVRSPDLAVFGPVIPVEDFPLHYALSNCFVGSDGKGTPISNLIMPQGIGNTPAATFSVIHDLYPMVGTVPSTEFYGNSLNKDSGYPDGNPDDGLGKTLSQLAISYLCAKRDGSPYILRFEDERDGTAALIQRALAFRTLMEQASAPHEYMVALSDNVLLIARQFGFAVINKGGDYTLTKADLSKVPGVYIPNGTYDEILGLVDLSDSDKTKLANKESVTRTVKTTSNIQLGSDSLTATGSANTVYLRNARFFALRNAPSAASSTGTVTFQVNNATTLPGQQAGVLGNHPLLGNWTIRRDLFNGLLNKASASDIIYPTWKSIPISFPAGLTIPYKFVKVNSDGATIDQWETVPDRTLTVAPGDQTLSRDYNGVDSVTVTFTVNHAETKWGQNVYLIGSSPELGNWDTTKAVLMNPVSYPAWTVTMTFGSSFPMKFKYIKRDLGETVWIGDPDLTIDSSTSSITNEWK